VSVDPIICDPKTVQELQKNLLVFYTGIARKAGSILKHKQQALNAVEIQNIVLRMTVLARHLSVELQDNNLQAFGEILHENWLLKRSICSSVSSPQIDRWYHLARKHGAIGGKLLGAGTGGFLLFYAPQKKHSAIRMALGLRLIDINFEPQGSKIIFVH
jgi:D-glycero-alpha-D-manno-heptose-7-phosphate kinase